MHSAATNNDGEQRLNQHHPTKDSPSNRCNRSSFPCSSQSYTSPIPTLLTMSSSSYSSCHVGSNPSSPDSNGNSSVLSDDISKESAILLYQAFVGNKSEREPNGAIYKQSTAAGDTSLLQNHTYSGDQKHSSCHELESSFQERIMHCESNRTEQNKNTSPSNYQQVVNQGKQNDEDSTNSADSHSTQKSEDQTTTTSMLSRHRRKIGGVIITLTSLWLYSKYKQRSRRNHRLIRHGQGGNFDLREQKLHALYKLLLQVLSHLRISKLVKQLNNTKLITGSSNNSSTKAALSYENATTAPLAHLLAMAKTGNVSRVMLRGSVISYLHSMQSATSSDDPTSSQPKKQAPRWSKTILPSSNPNFLQEILSTLLNNGCDDITTLPESLWQRFLNGPALVAFPFAYLGALYWIMRRLQKQQLDDGENDNSFNGSAFSDHPTTFDDVAGIDSALHELAEVVAYVRNPNTFHCVGASPPRGILLHGPPGSGKTLLARAIAGEAGKRAVGATGPLGEGATIDCFTVCSGSEFVETYVGRGAARVRSLFRGVREQAWKNYVTRQRVNRRSYSSGSSVIQGALGSMHSFLAGSTCAAHQEGNSHQRPIAIIFIDEIDALAKSRDSGGFSSSLGGCDEREQTLNQLLTEMDGFSTGSAAQHVTEGPSGVIVIVIAATNRIDVLDPAILRAGRFDRHVQIPLPDEKGREAILRVHARRIKYDASSVNFVEVADRTENFSGADLKNVINEAALLAVRTGNSYVKQQHLLHAIQKVSNTSSRSRGENRHQGSHVQWFLR